MEWLAGRLSLGMMVYAGSERVGPNISVILRILHEAMEPQRHLGADEMCMALRPGWAPLVVQMEQGYHPSG